MVAPPLATLCVMNRHDDSSRQGLAAPLHAGALDAVNGYLRQAEGMILQTEELETSLAAAIPPLSIGPLVVALHVAWAELDARLQYLGSLSGAGSDRELGHKRRCSAC